MSERVQHGVTSAILGGARVIASGPTIPVTEEIFVSVNFKYLVSVCIKCDSLCSRGLQVLHKVDFCVTVGRSRILREVGTLICCVGNIRPGAIL